MQAQALRNPVQQALSQGVNVVVLNTDLGIEHPHLAYVLTEDQAGGRIAAGQIAQILHERGTAGIVGVDLSVASSLQRDRALETELQDKHPGIHVVGRVSVSSNLASEQQDILRFMDESRPDVLVALTPDATQATYLAVHSWRAAMPNAESPKIVGFDQTMIDSVRIGEVAALIAMPADSLGRVAAHLLCEAAAGRPVPLRTAIPPVLITAQTIDTAAVRSETNRVWWQYP